MKEGITNEEKIKEQFKRLEKGSEKCYITIPRVKTIYQFPL